MAIVREQKEAARQLGITDRALRLWTKEPGFPDWSAGWDVDAIQAWRDEHSKKGSPEVEALQKAKFGITLETLKQERIKTQAVTLALQEKEGSLLPRPAWERLAATLLSSLADWCDQLPDLLQGDCCPKCRKKVPDRLKAELDRLREQLADDLKQTPAEGRS